MWFINDSTDRKIRKRYTILKILFGLLLLLFGFTVYINYDYMVFKLLIAGNYVYTDTLDKIYTDELGKDNFKSYMGDFDRAVIAVFTEKIRGANSDNYTYLYTPKSYKASKESEKADAITEEVRRLTDDTVYLKIPNISKYTREFVYKNKGELAKYKNIIIDVRSNYGGMLNDYYLISDLFLENGATIGFEKTRLPIFTREVKSKKKPLFAFENIIFLQDEGTASSAEGLIMSLKENLDNVKLIGAKTFGKGIGQVTIPLTGGYAVKATIMTLETPNRNVIHKVGIQPDYEFDAEANNEELIKKALELIS